MFTAKRLSCTNTCESDVAKSDFD
ncbi:MAG: hypothetical protein V7634_1511, partial [Bradyrhizobium sp.]